MRFLFLFVLFMQSNIVFADSAIIEENPIPTIIAIVIAVQIGLRGIAECLTRISVYTKNKLDNKIAAILSEIAWILGVAIGKIGYSVPKLVVEEKAKKINEKGN